MVNVRGNKYSRKHKHLNPDHDSAFWNFSFHEIGISDLPATIDYILRKTRKSVLYYVGHTQGATAMYVLMSHFPQYNRKIKVYAHISPIVFMSHLKSPPIRLLADGLKIVRVCTIYYFSI